MKENPDVASHLLLASRRSPSVRKEIALAWLRLLKRDYRAGELAHRCGDRDRGGGRDDGGVFTDRVQRALTQQANWLLGADLVIADSRPISPELKNEAARQGLSVVEVARFPSMVVQGERNMLADVKVVTKGFPLRGNCASPNVCSALTGAPQRSPNRGPYGWTNGSTPDSSRAAAIA